MLLNNYIFSSSIDLRCTAVLNLASREGSLDFFLPLPPAMKAPFNIWGREGESILGPANLYKIGMGGSYLSRVRLTDQ